MWLMLPAERPASSVATLKQNEQKVVSSGRQPEGAEHRSRDEKRALVRSLQPEKDGIHWPLP